MLISPDGKTALKEKGIDQLLEDARESNRESDLEHLKRRCASVSYAQRLAGRPWADWSRTLGVVRTGSAED